MSKKQEQEIQAAKDRMMLVTPLIVRTKEQHNGEDWRGIKECPVCKGKLHLTHAKYNGHVWGRCETQDCLHWAE